MVHSSQTHLSPPSSSPSPPIAATTTTIANQTHIPPMMTTKPVPTKHCHVLAIPSMGRGHINPLLNLCKLMARKKPNQIHITFVVTEEWLGLLSSSDQPPPPPSNLKYAAIPNILPPERGRGAVLVGFMEAQMTKMGQPVEQLLDRLKQPVQLIITDTVLFWAVEMANRRNIPVASFWPMSASMFSLLYNYDLVLDKSLNFSAQSHEGQDSNRIDYIPGISPILKSDLPYIPTQEHKSKLTQLGLLQGISNIKSTQYLLFRTIPNLEKEAINTLNSILPVPAFTVGPCISSINIIPPNNAPKTHDHQVQPPSYISWLDSHPPNSVLYVSLGTVMPVSTQQVEELAAGLRRSGVRFLWVSRLETVRFEGGAGERWMVVPWVDQMRVLAHDSVGGFLSHCGWNSTLEGVVMGVPMITFPLLFDQKANSKLVVEDWGVGWRGAEGEMSSLAGSAIMGREKIAEVVKRFMDLETDERKGLERKCRELSEMAGEAIVSGSAEAGLDAFLGTILKT